MLQLAHLFGVAGVDIVDVNPAKLEAARTLGARQLVTDAAQAVAERGWDVVIDASGAPPANADGLTRWAKGGTSVQFGVASPSVRVEMDPFDIYEREIRTSAQCARSTASLAPSNCWQTVLQTPSPLSATRFRSATTVPHLRSSRTDAAEKC